MANQRKIRKTLREALTAPAPWEADPIGFLSRKRHRTRGEVETWKAARKRKQIERQEAAMAARPKRQFAWLRFYRRAKGRKGALPAGLIPGRQPMRILARMAPGRWYAAADIGELTGLPRTSVQAIVHQRLERRGMVERGRNAQWDPHRARRGMHGANPKFLWRLTAKGEAVAEFARMAE